jgi:hypothetical protein
MLALTRNYHIRKATCNLRKVGYNSFETHPIEMNEEVLTNDDDGQANVRRQTEEVCMANRKLFRKSAVTAD